MPEGVVGLPADGPGKKLRTRTRAVGANPEVHEQFVIPIPPRTISGRVLASSFRIAGAAALTHNLFTLENAAASTVTIALRSLQVLMDHTAALAAVAPSIKMSRPTALPTGGTPLTKVLLDSGVSAAGVVARGANAADGGAATAITATAGAAGWTRIGTRLHTAAGIVLPIELDMLPPYAADDPMVLAPGQAVLVQVVAAATTSNPATNWYHVNAAWDEYTV